MTEDLRDISSTSPKQVNTRLHENFFAELLLSLIITTSILSCLMAIRGFSENNTIGAYHQFVTLLLAAIHTYIRRKFPNLIPCFLLHIVSSAVFYFALILIPFLQFGHNLANMIYFAVIVFIFTVFSISYRMNPTFSASTSNVVAFPACIFPVCGIFYAMMRRTDLIENLIINTILIAVMFLVMRQIAVFDEKYYHSIRRSSRPVRLLKRQNYLTAMGLVGVFAVSLILLRFLPISVLSEAIQNFLLMIVPFLIRLLLAILDMISKLFEGNENTNPADGFWIEPEEAAKDEPWLRVLGIVIAILILIGLALLIINTLRLIIINAPVYRKDNETSGDGNIIDTIEDLRPAKKAIFRKNRDFGKGYERRIRKQFYEKTSRAMRKGLPVYASSTPGQIEKVLKDNGDKDIAALRQEYEKVRYGK